MAFWKEELECFMMPREGVEQYIDCLVDEDVRIHEEDRTGPSFSMNENEDLFTCLLSEPSCDLVCIISIVFSEILLLSRQCFPRIANTLGTDQYWILDPAAFCHSTSPGAHCLKTT
jgi:hypothetical protein